MQSFTKNIGVTIKEIRENKRIKQKELVGGIISMSNLLKIEKGESTPSYDKVVLLCDKLGITLTELIYCHNKYGVTEKEEIIQDYRRLKNSLDEDPFTKLINKINVYLKENPSDYQIAEMRAVLLAAISINKTQKFDEAKELVAPIWERLQRQNEWYHFDLMIISQSIYIFSEDDAKEIIKTLISQADKYNYYVDNNQLKISVLMNISLYLKINHSILASETYIDEAISLCKQHRNLPLEYTAYAKKAEIEMLKGNEVAAYKLIDKSLGFFKYVGDDKLHDDLKLDWELFLDNIDVYKYTKELQINP
ncbi:helix-turn-helix domain-containing protein [Listeria newyorkensis]|uniref:Helix-turn-helix transcriptional regulator n=1 Tax=Listeria newyorkensis TaxID=1497681 RepID=A0A841YU09_9LIST|nr:helix-turn-helix transcriptional regulator [Listeria newyorkensis]MBC1456253.1 helix-turn-helix transcriptional regulator [Listeria newyorkensis]